ncbi:MAG: cytochrome C [Acidobacteria bacterium]|nr:cytochrome C [Acidobacteriota bacterium]
MVKISLQWGVALSLALALAVLAPGAMAQDLPDGPGKAEVETQCSTCHNLNRVVNHKDSLEGWQALVDQMVGMGAMFTDDDKTVIATYLASNFPDKAPEKAPEPAAAPAADAAPQAQRAPASAPAAPAGANAAALDVKLPEGVARAFIEESCVQCHALSRIARAGNTRVEWERIVEGMIRLGSPLAANKAPMVVDYLAAAFPNKSPKPKLLPGSVEISIKEWQVPTPGSRPHDPLVTPDGMAWYTGQRANVLGRFDPKTEKFTEFPLPEKHGPHGLINDKEGNIWYTANSAAAIGKLDPKTGKVTEYKMPDPKARDPHTPIFTPDGNLFFSLQGANMVGRLNPKTGEVKLVSFPTPRSNPYGMVVDSKGTPWVCEFGGNRLASIDPVTMELKEYSLPAEGARPRRIAITSDDAIWFADYARGYLGRFDTKTHTTKEWASPSGPESQPYGIEAIKDVIWYNESGVEPNTVVRFDPKSEKFQTWIIPSGGGVVRNMSHTADGKDLWMATSGVNGIARVTIGQ